MPYCKKCGGEVSFNETSCRTCGAPQQNSQQRPTTQYNDPGGLGYTLLGFCVPIVGLVLFLVWQQDKPKSAKAAGIGALINVGVGILFFIIYFIFIVGMIATTGY